MSKYFILGGKQDLTKEQIRQIEKDSEDVLVIGDADSEIKAKTQLEQEDTLVHVEGKIVVKVDMKNKDKHRFDSGIEIRYERNFNNFNRRETQPVNCIVISAEGIPKGAEILVDHNAFHETNRINDYKNHFENDGSDRVRYFSLSLYECYAWRVGVEDWKPFYPYEFAIRLFKPYKGSFENIDPELIKDTLYVLSGDLKGNVVRTVKAADYCLVFQNENGREQNLITFRPMGDPKRHLEEEAIAILHDETKKVNKGELLLGYEIKDAKPLKDVPIN